MLSESCSSIAWILCFASFEILVKFFELHSNITNTFEKLYSNNSERHNNMTVEFMGFMKVWQDNKVINKYGMPIPMNLLNSSPDIFLFTYDT